MLTTHVVMDKNRTRKTIGIPPGYSTKNWDPGKEPIVVLGSVFDANSLGKWIYDWTVHTYGRACPMSDVAGNLWLLLIRLAGKAKRADVCMCRIMSVDEHELVNDFLESGERLWVRLRKILKACEESMVSTERRRNKGGIPAIMSSESGRVFVKTLLGRDRELENTESSARASACGA